MKHAKKMVLVELKPLEEKKSHNEIQSAPDVSKNDEIQKYLSNQIDLILNDTKLTDAEKYSLYLPLMNSYFIVSEKVREERKKINDAIKSKNVTHFPFNSTLLETFIDNKNESAFPSSSNILLKRKLDFETPSSTLNDSTDTSLSRAFQGKVDIGNGLVATVGDESKKTKFNQKKPKNSSTHKKSLQNLSNSLNIETTRGGEQIKSWSILKKSK